MARRFVISVLLVAVALTAQARTRPHYGGTLRIEIQGDPWQMPDGLARRLVLDTLATVSDTGTAQPALAVRWTAQNADHRWEFTLRPGVRFQDGAPLTAEAVVTALNDVCSRGAAANPPMACPWRMIRAVGDSVIFVSDTAVPDLPALLAQESFAIARQDTSGTIIGTGPFRVTGFANGALLLAANDDCWAGRPFADSVEIHPHRTVRDQWLDLSVGRADIVEVPPEMIRPAQQQHLSLLVSRPVDLLALTIAPNGPFSGREMRQAIALAVDRAALSNVIFQKQGEVTASLLPQALSGYAFLFSTDRNLDRARALRGGASPTGVILSAEDTSATLHLAAERLALNLHEAGFAVRVATTPARQPTALTLRRVHLEAASPAAALDEMLARFGQNGTVTATDPVSLWQTERGVLENDTIVPLLWSPRAWAAGDRVRDLRLWPDGAPRVADASLEGAK
ncbi:MAG TPA: ABC transporter substrate-binding protein [Acidobacteriaceae bacterium]|jgi:ABC-type transport system substrate-binding protein|nr:ABC transporter substrate-binding protein [Acidobacteriaceae bacterium]